MSGLAGLSRGTRVPICPDTICVPWDRDRDRSLRDERDRDKFSRDCPAWLSRGTSGTGTKNRGTVPSRPLPIPGHNDFTEKERSAASKPILLACAAHSARRYLKAGQEKEQIGFRSKASRSQKSERKKPF